MPAPEQDSLCSGVFLLAFGASVLRQKAGAAQAPIARGGIFSSLLVGKPPGSISSAPFAPRLLPLPARPGNALPPDEERRFVLSRQRGAEEAAPADGGFLPPPLV